MGISRMIISVALCSLVVGCAENYTAGGQVSAPTLTAMPPPIMVDGQAYPDIDACRSKDASMLLNMKQHMLQYYADRGDTSVEPSRIYSIISGYVDTSYEFGVDVGNYRVIVSSAILYEIKALLITDHELLKQAGEQYLKILQDQNNSEDKAKSSIATINSMEFDTRALIVVFNFGSYCALRSSLFDMGFLQYEEDKQTKLLVDIVHLVPSDARTIVRASMNKALTQLRKAFPEVR